MQPSDWGYLLRHMQKIVSARLKDGMPDTLIDFPKNKAFDIRTLVALRMTRCMDTLTLQCMQLDYTVELAAETERIAYRVGVLRSKIYDTGLTVTKMSIILQEACDLEREIMQLMARRRRALCRGNDFVCEWKVDGHVDLGAGLCFELHGGYCQFPAEK